MDNSAMKLSKVDKAILQSYLILMDGLANFLGSGFEFVLHSLVDINQSVIKIINGHHTGRREGAPITDFALSILKKIQSDGLHQYMSYNSQNSKGEPLKSTTIIITGENGRAIGLLCINFALNTPLSEFVCQFFDSRSEATTNIVSENYAGDVDNLIARAVSQITQAVEADGNILPSLKNKEIVCRLYRQGIFQFKDSVNIIADLMSISKNTIYMHLRSINSKE